MYIFLLQKWYIIVSVTWNFEKMRVNTVSFNAANRAAALRSKSNNSQSVKISQNPSFSGVSLGRLSRQEIGSLYYDARELTSIVDEAVPLLEKKFNGFFDAILSVFPDLERSINVNIRTDKTKAAQLRDYIVKKNDIFQFPSIMIDDFKNGCPRKFDKWLYDEHYIPLAFDLEKAGSVKTAKTVIRDFSEDINTDKIILDMYNNTSHEFKSPKKAVPTYYWEFPGG